MYALHFERLEKPLRLIDGSISYGELETCELVPYVTLKNLVYVGMRDATQKEEREIEYKFEREIRARNAQDKALLHGYTLCE